MHFDIIIVGGGMVGATLACALRDTPLQIALVDATPQNPQEDHRLIALNHTSICLLKNLNLWSLLAPNATAIKEVHVSHRGHFGMTRLRANEVKLEALGYVVPAKYITSVLYQNLSHVTHFRPATLKKLTQDSDIANLTLTTSQDENTIQGKIVIGADGTQSTVRELLNIAIKKIDYHQSALVTITELNRSHNNIAYERFQQNGAIAMLPLSENHAATIWSDENERISQLMKMNDEEFVGQLQKHFGYRLGKLKKIAKRYVYPLQFVEAKETIKQNVILIGNAAHTLHPIAAQGLNLALYEIAHFVEEFNKSSVNSEKLAEKQQKISKQLSHQLSQIFTYDFFMMKAARQLGMLGLDISTDFKKYFIRKSLGHSENLPPLCMEK